MTTRKSVPGYPPFKNPLSAIFMMNGYMRHFLERVEQDFARFGDLFSFEIGGQQMLMLCDPDMIHEITTRQASQFVKDATYTDPRRGLAYFLRNGLLISDGEFWRRQRKLMSPAFHHKRLMSYGEIIVRESVRVIDQWRGVSEADVDADMMHATLDIVAKALFSSDMNDADVQRIGAAMTSIQAFSADQTQQILPQWIPLPSRMAQRKHIAALDEIVYRVIAEHRAMGDDNGDLLWMLLNARDEDGNGMTDRQLRDELVTLFLAGHETTANTLNWVWVLLAQNPQVEARLHEELDRVLGGRLPTLDDLKSLTYTEQVIKEAMRLYPPAFVFSRMPVEDMELGGYPIKKGAQITVMSWSVHRDARWYPDPLAFKPERWTPDFEASLPKGAYIPFGGGPRICIGMNFALMEANLLLAALASRYQLRLIGDAPAPLPQLTLRPKGGLHMRITPRAVEPVAERASFQPVERV